VKIQNNIIDKLLAAITCMASLTHDGDSVQLAKVVIQAFPIDWQLIGIRQNIMAILA
tara:strand:- start:242 stop:412 length:171 start_codon:yes stop_codon:yes gene_type:complete